MLKFLVTIVALLAVSSAQAATFYTDRTTFLADTSSPTTLDLENIAEPFLVKSYQTYSQSGVTFSSFFGQPTDLLIADANNFSTLGAPYSSDLLLGNFADQPVTATFAAPVSAVGADFGSVYGPLTGTLQIFGTGGLLDSREVTLGNMGVGTTPTFYGFTTTSAIITSLVFTTGFPGIDNFTFGQSAIIAETPIPGALPLFASALGLGGFFGWKRKRKAALVTA